MKSLQMYEKLIKVLHYTNKGDVQSIRTELQDVLCSLRDAAALETGLSEQEIQDEAESKATVAAWCELVG